MKHEEPSDLCYYAFEGSTTSRNHHHNQRTRNARDEVRDRLDFLDRMCNMIAHVHDSLSVTIATSSRDWSLTTNDAWAYGILMGWDYMSLKQLQVQHGWSDNDIERLSCLRNYYQSITTNALERQQKEMK